MARTIILLLVSLIAIPILVYQFDTPPTSGQWELLKCLGVVYVITSALCFIVSTISRNYSQVDKLWSIMPIVYVWIVIMQSDYEPRQMLMAVFVTLWGLRLTYNFSRRGGYHWKFWEGEEDYRWAVLRQKPLLQNPVIWMLFNLFFISFYQMGLVLLFTLPIVKVNPGGPLSFWDWILACVFLVLLIIETVADQQQWNFQKEKHRRMHTGENLKGYAHGFVRTGLWGIVRHPNYAAEQGIWIVIYLFSVIATGSWFNWSVAGVLLLLILFHSSAEFSEGLSAGKYPEYREYRKKVGRFIPGLKGLFRH